MQKIFARGRTWIMAATLAASALPLLAPTPAAAWWYHRGWGWHHAWGWRPCCWRPGVVVGVAPPVVVVPPPPRVVIAPPPVVYASPRIGY